MKRWLPTREQLKASRWLRPVAHRLDDESLWHFDRGSVARAVAIGLFFGFLVPVAQFLLAIAAAIALRGNIAIAAAATVLLGVAPGAVLDLANQAAQFVG